MPERREHVMTQTTGTRDETYDIISVLYHALQGAESCATYEKDAVDDEELLRFFQQARARQRELADQAKTLLRARIARDTGGESSAFSFGQGGASEAEATTQRAGPAASEI
jgi:hypothetical protein